MFSDIDPSLLVPFLPGNPINATAPETRTTPQSSIRDSMALAPSSNPPAFGIPSPMTDPAEEIAPSRSRSRSPLSTLDSIDLARSLAPFRPEALPLSQGTASSFDAASSPDPGDFPSRSPFDPMPASASTSAQSGLADFGFDGRESGGGNPGSEGGGSSSSSGLDARLTRTVERLERIADQLDPSSSSSAGRGGPSRPFRGRVDA